MRKALVVVTLVVSVAGVAAQNWTPPRTPWGEPDLQGNWPGVDMLGVPFERPANLAGKATLTDEELAQLPAARRAANNANDVFFGESRSHWREYGRPQRQTSMIVDPADGRLPPLTPDGARRALLIPNEGDGSTLAGPENASPLARCLSRGPFGSMLPIANSNGNHIIQSPGLVVIRNEMIHEARLIPVDGRPHVGARIRSYMGDSRGHWEGPTLVVDTSNFNDMSNYSGGRRPYSRDARLNERFTRVDRNTIRYEATVDDPKTWARPWTVAFPLRQDANYYLYEFACHEGNYLSMLSMLGGARLAEK